jgi:hypothetical protein
VPRSSYAKIQGGKKIVVDQKQLAKSDAKSFAAFFKSKSKGAQIPWIMGPASLIPGVGSVITLTTSTIDGLQRMGQPPINSDQLTVLMAEGGSFLRTVAEEPATRFTATVFYNVGVGSETRMYAICSATYGLNVVG